MLHIANGSCTTRLIEMAGIPGRLSIWADPLYEGPVPGNVGDDELIRVRAHYLSGGTADESSQIIADLQQWRAVLEGEDARDEVVLWFEHDLFDQLNLIQLLSWISSRRGITSNVSLVEVGSFPGRESFKGLGELSPAELKSLFPGRQRITADRYALAQRAWTAFRDNTPATLNELPDSGTSAMPFLRQALIRLLQEYPWTTDGLSLSERRLLEVVAGGPIEVPTIFRQMHRYETAYYLTDLSLLALLRAFSQCDPPLIVMTGESLAATGVPDAKAAISADGRTLLNGVDDRVARYGLDRWIGGVHLTSEHVWRFDPALARVV